MADFDIPADLLDLQRAFYAADAECERIGNALPSSTEIYRGADVDWTLLDQARAKRMEILDRLHAHPWFDSLEDSRRSAARIALRAAARSSGD